LTARNDDLLYVADGNTVYVYTYPDGNLAGTLGGFYGAEGLCTDRLGNVWITDYNGFRVLEYAHAGTMPIAILKDPERFPKGCAVSPISGDLAVANDRSLHGHGNVMIYAKGKGRGKGYFSPAMTQYELCVYDTDGNLFIGGSEQARLEELPSGDHKLKTVLLHNYVLDTIQWDGRYIVMGAGFKRGKSAAVTQITVAGLSAQKVKNVKLDAINGKLYGNDEFPFWIGKGRILLIDSPYAKGEISIWRYPQGGESLKTITGPSLPRAITVSAASRM
ncbi:MAG: hypothetical protein JO092_00825, partial [Candidatus Eremiobacteraeota bacterium]|nr:hypothetical protein [Candidatus Eremiobacteraeota bacterium]